MRVTWAQVAAWRARRHHLVERAPAGDMLGVVGRLGGMHAQVMSSAELSLWARVEGLGPEDVPDALWERRTLVKTWAMRGTLHLLPSAEYPLWQAALSRYDHYEKPGWFRGFRVTKEEMDRAWAAGAEALDGDPLTRAELVEAIVAQTGSPEVGEKIASGFGSLLKPLSYRGQLCFAPNAGRNIRFTRPSRWLAGVTGPAVAPDDAAREVTRRFLAAYGPATREDYAHWWGVITPAAAGRLIAALGDEAVTVDVGGPAWPERRRGPMSVLAANVDDLAAAKPARSVRLLPAFDQYVISASPHAERLLPGDELRPRIYRPQAWLSPVVAVDGRFAGVWRHEQKGGRVTVAVEPFASLPAWARRGVRDEAGRLAEFLGGRLDLSIS
ncbi:MAG: winged helix DNA-binding domain-containing protein [Acidimicrobiales bacterium]